MEKLVLFPLLLAAGCVLAGVYGMLHNQISYTVAPDYFFAYKFDQFHIPDELRNRLGTSLVGWHASWWMGIIIGIPILIVGLILPSWKQYLRCCLIAFAIVAATALVVGLGALMFAYCTITEATLPDYWYSANVTDRVAFARAGMMHNFSYLGGGIGILTGSVYLIVERVRQG